MPRKFIDIYDLQDHTEEMTTLVQKEISEGQSSGSSVKIDKEVPSPSIAYSLSSMQESAGSALPSVSVELDSLTDEDILEKDIFNIQSRDSYFEDSKIQVSTLSSVGQANSSYAPLDRIPRILSTNNPFFYIYNDIKNNHNNYSLYYRVKYTYDFYNKLLTNKYLQDAFESGDSNAIYIVSYLGGDKASLIPENWGSPDNQEDPGSFPELTETLADKFKSSFPFEYMQYLIKPDKPLTYSIDGSVYSAYPVQVTSSNSNTYITGAVIKWAIFERRDAFAWKDALNINPDTGTWICNNMNSLSIAEWMNPYEGYQYRNNPESIFLNGGIPVVSNYVFSYRGENVGEGTQGYDDIGSDKGGYIVSPVLQATFGAPTIEDVVLTNADGEEVTYSKASKECTLYYASIDSEGTMSTKSVTNTYDAAIISLDIPFTCDSDFPSAAE